MNQKQPRTIITYLIDGIPNGLRTIELSNWIGKGICFPRAKMKEALARSELQSPGLYFLVGGERQGVQSVYIGEAEILSKRVSQHDKKDFWNLVICFSSKDQALTKADVKFLESRAVDLAVKAGQFDLMNSVNPVLNNLPEYQAASMEEFLSNIRTLVSALGYPVMESLTEPGEEQLDTYSIQSKDAKAQGMYNENGFVVSKGSTVSSECTKSCPDNIKVMKEKLIAQGILQSIGTHHEFVRDHAFSSPSMAAGIVCGSSQNGWTRWKSPSGKTLDEMVRIDG
jgi:hypothetical protein